MGLLRLFLASMVMLTHLGYSFFGVSPGVSAVIVFYLLAGHVVSQLWAKRQGRGAALWFYQDRLWRIVPLYLVALILAIVLWLIGVQSPFLSREPHWQDWLANLLIVPLNYYMFTGQDAFTLLPPTWSLGVELQFYVLVPLLLGRPQLQMIVTILSLVVFTLAQFGVLNTDVFGYRLLGGVGFVFLAGTLLDKRDFQSRALLGLLWLTSAIYAFWLLISDRHVPYNTEVAVGLALGLPLLQVFLRFPRKGLWQSIQRKAGELSYGVFLMHFPVIWLLEILGQSGPQTAWKVFVLSALLAWLAHVYVERPLWQRFRFQR